MAMSKDTACQAPTAEGHRAQVAGAELPVTIIRPPQGWAGVGYRELYASAELISCLIWRDIKVRYKQTVIGAAWAILQPFITMVVFTVVFGRLDRMSPEGLPYPLFAFSALVPWTYFTHALTTASNSVVVHRTLITKVYFPRVVLPLAAVLGGLMDFAIAFSMLLGMLLFYGIIPTAAVWTLPFFLFLMTATALGVGLWLAALHVQYRDIGNALPFLMQVWLFATPIAYPSNLIPESWRVLYSLNPMVGVVEGFRWALLGTGQAPGACLSASIVAVAGVLISGLYFFRRQEDFFADVV